MTYKNSFSLIASGLLFAFNVFAAPVFQGTPVITHADVVVKQDSQIYMNATWIDLKLPENSDELIGKRFFQLEVGSTDANNKISLAGGNETIIQSDGTVYSAQAQRDGTRLVGIVDEAYKNRITADTAYLPAAANKSADAAALLFSGKSDYTFNINGADITQNVTPGEYVFSFVAQAYTE
ncbi:Uncharacterised protein [Cedecea neteri]|uniref:Uncharacterized protein n=1 Tax=Cedecea neteri TaxID=158822 RepID=A0A291DWT1_9ENTR|nr:hypothetical protein [Cedecea neteri]ATF92086.1 hypothetical protein CO704_08315 [Cedecea neteri]SQC90739.1 Uncharacterised protein [Cedecea neteri]